MTGPVTLRRAHVYWLCQIAGWSSWTFVGLSYAYVTYAGSLAAMGPSLPVYGSGIAISIGWSSLYRLYIRRRGWSALPPGKLLLRVIPASFVLGVVVPYTNMPLYL